MAETAKYRTGQAQCARPEESGFSRPRPDRPLGGGGSGMEAAAALPTGDGFEKRGGFPGGIKVIQRPGGGGVRHHHGLLSVNGKKEPTHTIHFFGKKFNGSSKRRTYSVRIGKGEHMLNF